MIIDLKKNHEVLAIFATTFVLDCFIHFKAGLILYYVIVYLRFAKKKMQLLVKKNPHWNQRDHTEMFKHSQMITSSSGKKAFNYLN